MDLGPSCPVYILEHGHSEELCDHSVPPSELVTAPNLQDLRRINPFSMRWLSQQSLGHRKWPEERATIHGVSRLTSPSCFYLYEVGRVQAF